MVIDSVSSWFSALLVAGGGGGAVAYCLFKYLGSAWLDSKFSKSLEAFKHQQEIEIRHFQLNIDTQFNARKKIQDEEYVILPTAWKRLNLAWAEIESVVTPLQSYPDVKRMSPERFKFLLENYRFSKFDIEDLMKSSDRENDFIKALLIYRASRARKRLWTFYVYIKNNAIMLPSDIKPRFEELSNHLRAVIIGKELGAEVRDFKMQNEAWKTLSEKVKPLYMEIEDIIYNRLHHHSGE